MFRKFDYWTIFMIGWTLFMIAMVVGDAVLKYKCISMHGTYQNETCTFPSR